MLLADPETLASYQVRNEESFLGSCP